MIISFKKQFIFLHLPKTGGTSLRDRLLVYAPLRDRLAYSPKLRRALNLIAPGRVPLRGDAPGLSRFRTHANLSVIEQKFGRAALEPFFIFTIARNPFTRLYSHYKHMRATPWHPLHETVSAQSFDDYIGSILARKKPMTQWRHTQWRDGNAPALNFYLRLEAYDEDFHRLREALGLNKISDAKKLNVGSYEQPDYAALYGDKAAAIVESYRQDFEYFGYPTDPARALEAPPPCALNRQHRCD